VRQGDVPNGRPQAGARLERRCFNGGTERAPGGPRNESGVRLPPDRAYRPDGMSSVRNSANGGSAPSAPATAPRRSHSPARAWRPERLGPGEETFGPPDVVPGQVWNDESVRGTGGPLLVISVDSAYAYCRDGREGDGEPRRIPLGWFDERRRGGLRLVSDAQGPADRVGRRALTALWELDYVGRPATTENICALLGGIYSVERVEEALADAESRELTLRSEGSGEWRLTGGGRRIAAAA
jgi:hypothetical protein